MNSPKSVKEFPCPSCGANLQFNPQDSNLKCPYCGWEDLIPQSAAQVKERSYEEYFNQNRKLKTLSPTALEVKCSKCGADVTFEPPYVAGECPFCAAAIVAQPKIADPTLAPEGIVAFTISHQAARENIQKWLGSNWFVPNGLQQLAQQEKIEGVYLPFWTYDCHTVSHYKGERGDYDYVSETYTENSEGKTETKTRQVRHTQWHHVSGRVDHFYDDILIAATELVDAKRLDALEPWQLKESLCDYEPSYLAGFKAQRSQVTLQQGFESAKGVMADKILCEVRRDIGGDEQQTHNVSTAYSAITFKHILLPVWLCAYHYRNNQYQVMVNARTGEVLGDRPYSVWKIAVAVLTAVALVGGIVWLFNINKQKQSPNNSEIKPQKVLAITIPSQMSPPTATSRSLKLPALKPPSLRVPNYAQLTR